MTDEEISTIKSSGASVAFLSQESSFLWPYEPSCPKLLDAGINVGLGTDSLASNDTMSIIDEMKFLFLHHSIPPNTLLAMATINGAKALGLESKVGQIKEGFEADLCGVRLPDAHVGNIYDQLLDTTSKTSLP